MAKSNEYIDCTTISAMEGYGDRSDCMESNYSPFIDDLIKIQSTAMYEMARLNREGAERWRIRKAQSAYNDASRSLKRESRKVHSVVKTCLRQDPRNVCFRQKTMQTMWIKAPEIMDKVAKIFKHGYDAKSRSDAVKYMNKKGVPADEQAKILAQYDPKAPTNTGSWGQTSGAIGGHFGGVRFGASGNVSGGTGASASTQILMVPLAVGGLLLVLLFRR